MTNATVPQGLVPQAESSLDSKLFNARMGLLDLSARNRLLNTPRSAKNARTIEIIDERSAEVFRLLVSEERAMTFTPGRPAKPEDVEDEPGEIDAAMRQVTRESFGATRDELIQSCSRIFGYSATSTQLRTLFASRIDALVQNGSLAVEGPLLVSAVSS